MIRTISQRNNYDCAYATVAMAADTTYDEVETLVKRRIYRPKLGLTSNEQLVLLETLTGKVWESYTAPPSQRLADLSFTMMDDGADGEPAEQLRIILSTYWERSGRTFRHSIFCDGYRIFDPARHIWLSFSRLRRMAYYQRVYVKELLTQQGTFVQ